MGNLFLSFTVAIGSAIGLVIAGRALDLDNYINKIIPLVPVFYAITYEVLERRKTGRRGKAAPSREDAAAAAPRPGVEAGITASKVILDVAVSFAIKFAIEIFLVALFLRYSDLSFSQAYGSLDIGTVGRFLRGEHPWFMGSGGLSLLALVAVVTSFMTGIWIGNTSKGNAILEGVLAGAAVALINSMTNMLVLYRAIEDLTVRLADSMGYVMRAGFLVVIAVQVLLYGLWSGLSQMAKEERATLSAGRKSSKKTKD